MEHEVDEEIFVTSTGMKTHVKHIIKENVPLLFAYPILNKNGQKFRGAITVSAGYSAALYTCALKNDGTVWCWGNVGDSYVNQLGELGDGTTKPSGTPVQVLIQPGKPLTDIVKISAGGGHTCALKNDGSAWCWGANGGALGNNSKDNSSFAVPVADNHVFTEISVDGATTCAIDQKNAGLFCWGQPFYFQGFGGPGKNWLAPVDIPDDVGNPIRGVRALGRMPSADRFVAFQKNNDDSLWGLGTIPPGRDVGGPNVKNVFEQLGQFVDKNNKPIFARQATTGAGVSGHACVLNKNNNQDSTASCWGSNSSGKLGDGTNIDRQFPVLVLDPRGGALDHLTRIEAGYDFTCALRMPNLVGWEVWCWGDNHFGQLGDGTTNNSNLPVQVKF